MGAISDVRAHVASALSGLDVTVHGRTPSTVAPPCVVLVPGSPYVEPGASWGTRDVSLTVRIVVNAASGVSSADRMDDLIDAVVDALAVADVQVGSVPAPDMQEDPAVLTVDIPTTTNWTE